MAVVVDVVYTARFSQKHCIVRIISHWMWNVNAIQLDSDKQERTLHEFFFLSLSLLLFVFHGRCWCEQWELLQFFNKSSFIKKQQQVKTNFIVMHIRSTALSLCLRMIHTHTQYPCWKHWYARTHAYTLVRLPVRILRNRMAMENCCDLFFFFFFFVIAFRQSIFLSKFNANTLPTLLLMRECDGTDWVLH